MENSNSNKLMFATGIIAGAAAVYFLKSDTGKKTMEAIAERSEEIKSQINEQSKSLINQGKDIIDETLEKGNSLLNTAKYKLNEQEVNLSETSPLSDFEKGVAKALKRIQNSK